MKKQKVTIDFQNLPHNQREKRLPKTSISAKKVSVFVYLLKNQNFSTDSNAFKNGKEISDLFLSTDFSKGLNIFKAQKEREERGGEKECKD